MCGIVGYVGKQDAYPIIIKGLQRLEYRGYDSSGVALLSNNSLNVYKKQGKVSKLEKFALDKDVSGIIGIGHTRWATHGQPNDVNAHPHLSNSGKFAMIHNGIIENYASIKEELIKRGYTFHSDTDTEVLVNLIDDIVSHSKISLEEAVREALTQVVGAYAIVLVAIDNPRKLVAAKKGSPLVIGIGKDEFFFASDATPIVEYTKNVVYLEEEEIAVADLDKGLTIKTLKNQDVAPYVQELAINIEALEKGGYEHFMLKEIFEQPQSIYDSMRGRLNPITGEIAMSSLKEYEGKLLNAKRIIIIGCGTSWHAGLVAEYLIEDIARIPVEVEYASEFRYRNPIITEDDVVIAISQSGETADTLAAIELAKSKGATIFGVCNVVGSTIARASHAGAYTHAGPEIGVASTKAFTSQVAVLTLIALALGKKKGMISESKYFRLISELNQVPEMVGKILAKADEIRKISAVYANSSNALYLGRGYSFPVALEGALKLKEISYIHAEGYPAAEMKHGPIALIDEDMPVFVVATQGPSYHKVVSNIQEVKARKGNIVAIVTEGDIEVRKIADHVIEIPAVDECLVPMLSVIPFQLLSYDIAVMRNCNVDQPRNLAKSVTVE
jgi:glucosamine--fructose-6-phosphate aminotransferase (isomerizing)